MMRGQTTLDFAIGISVFLAVLIFIFLFIPGLLSPFTEGAQEETVISNRVADNVTKSMLGSPDRPYALDRFCTVEFFDNNPAPAQCSGNWDKAPVEEQVGLDGSRTHINITVRGNVSAAGTGSDVLCWDADSESIAELNSGACSDIDDTVFQRGDPAPTDNDQSVTATRVVGLHRIDATVSVEVW